jgi:hypothetical protein
MQINVIQYFVSDRVELDEVMLFVIRFYYTQPEPL